MKILHVPFTYHPDPVGGTEVYVESLARQQLADGFEPVIVAPGAWLECNEDRGLKVWRFPVAERIDDLRELYGAGDQLAAQAFAKILEDERPDVVHLHALTRGVSLRLVEAAKALQMPVVFSYHTPTVSCQRGTLLRWGTEACDGALNQQTCAQCTLQGLGLEQSLSTIAGWIPSGLGRVAGAAGLSGGVWTAMRTTELIELRHATFHSLMQQADHVVAMSDWVRALLDRNGVPASKITMSRQGVPGENGVHGVVLRRRADGNRELSAAASPLRVMFLGRLDSSKGAHLVVEAVRLLKELPVTLDVFGVGEQPSAKTYLAMLKALADEDPRIAFHPAIPANAVVDRMRSYDVVAVPSQVLETGPLVVLEAFAAGLPVIGSRLGGIAELVTDGVSGLLVDTPTTEAWQRALTRLATDRTLVSRLARGVPAPRGIDAVAADMAAIYHRLMSESRRQRSSSNADADERAFAGQAH